MGQQTRVLSASNFSNKQLFMRQDSRTCLGHKSVAVEALALSFPVSASCLGQQRREVLLCFMLGCMLVPMQMAGPVEGNAVTPQQRLAVLDAQVEQAQAEQKQAYGLWLASRGDADLKQDYEDKKARLKELEGRQAKLESQLAGVWACKEQLRQAGILIVLSVCALCHAHQNAHPHSVLHSMLHLILWVLFAWYCWLPCVACRLLRTHRPPTCIASWEFAWSSVTSKV